MAIKIFSPEPFLLSLSVPESNCERNPCKNGGSCTEANPFNCDCPDGYTGKFCQIGKGQSQPSLSIILLLKNTNSPLLDLRKIIFCCVKKYWRVDVENY